MEFLFNLAGLAPQSIKLRDRSILKNKKRSVPHYAFQREAWEQEKSFSLRLRASAVNSFSFY